MHASEMLEILVPQQFLGGSQRHSRQSDPGQLIDDPSGSGELSVPQSYLNLIYCL